MKKTLPIILVATCLTILTSCRKPDIDDDKNKKKEIKITKTDSGKIVTLDSGLKYQILKNSNSDKSPVAGQKVTVHYAGWLEDKNNPGAKGAKFDSSVDRGQKFTFTIGLGQVIKGWDEGVMGMVVGEKRKLIIPYQLAYGQRGIPGIIPEKSTLIFEVELFDVQG